MKDLERKCFWAGIKAKFMTLLGAIETFCVGVCISHGELFGAVFPMTAAVICTYTGIQMTRYYKFLKAAKKKPNYGPSFSIHEVSRIKLTFSSFLSMYSANMKPWTSTENHVEYTAYRDERDGRSITYIESITIVYFDFSDYVKYRSWVNERDYLRKEAAKKKKDADAAETELKLNLQFLDTVSEDVKKMKESAEAEIQRAADELKKAAQQK